ERRVGLGAAGGAARRRLRADLAGGVAARPAVAAVARLPAGPAGVPRRAVHVLRELLPAAAGELLTSAAAEGRAAPLPERRQPLLQVLAGPGPLAGGGRVGKVLEHRLVRSQRQRREGGDLLRPGQPVLRRAQPLD